MLRKNIVAVGVVVLAGVFSAPAGAAQDPPPCDPGPCVKDVVIEKVKDLSTGDIRDAVDTAVTVVHCVVNDVLYQLPCR
jgi:hypothetical protein